MATSGADDDALLRYARYYGLTSDHAQENIDDIEFYVPPHGLDLEPALCSDEPYAALFPTFELPREKLELDAPSRQLLAEVLRPPAKSTTSFDDPVADRAAQASRLKLDLPLLSTDPEMDVLSVTRKKPQPTTFGKFTFDPLPVNEQAGEGLEWSKALLDLPRQYADSCKHEKLTITRNDALWLRDQLAQVDNPEAGDELTNTELKRRKVPEALTPPLSPGSTYEDLPAMSSPRIEDYSLLSEHTSPTVYLQKAVEHDIVQRDALDLGLPSGNVNFDTLANIYSPLRPSKTLQSSSPTRCRTERLRLEQPLTPPSLPQANTKSVSFSDELPHIIPDLYREIDDHAICDASAAEFHELFADSFGESSKKAHDLINHEKLIEADATMRLPVPKLVPKLDDAMPVPPWEAEDADKLLEDADRQMLWELKQMKLHKLPPSFERELRWNPLLVQPTPLDDLDESSAQVERDVEDFLSCLSIAESVDHETLSWKPDGLRILDHRGSDDEDLESGSFGPVDELSGLLHKRKYALEHERQQQQQPRIETMSLPTVTTKLVSTRPRPQQRSSHGLQNKQKGQSQHFSTSQLDKNADVPNIFDTSADLSHFMDLQAGHVSKKRKLDVSSLPPAHTSAMATVQVQVPASPTAPLHRAAEPSAPLQRLPDPPAQSEPVDLNLNLTLPDPTQTHQMIVSTTFLVSHRALLTHLTRLCPTLEMIERDFAGLEGCNFDPQSKIKKVASANGAPDLLLSPRCAVVVTSMQKLLQKALPGSVGQGLSPLRSRVAAVARSCERCVVLVSGFKQARGRGSDVEVFCADGDKRERAGGQRQRQRQRQQEKEAMALAEFVSFTSSLSAFLSAHTTEAGGGGYADVEVLTTPCPHSTEGGGEGEVARYILDLLATEDADLEGTMQHAGSTEGGEGILIHDTTIWELFLRRAGMNAYAAQAVLKLSAQSTQGRFQGGVEGTGGLPAFVAMSAVERRQRFDGILGGIRVLDCVSSTLDILWRT